jgi:tetratricopeptide (TPR) repeat protein
MRDRPEAGRPAETSHDEALRGVLPDLTVGQRRAQLHLLNCPACRGKAAAALRQAPGASGDRPEEEEDAGAMWQRLAASEELSKLLGEGVEETATAAGLLSELLAMAPEDRREVVQRERYLSPFLLEMLLRQARGAQPDNPDASCSLAALATQLAWCLKERSAEDSDLWNPEMTRAVNLTGNARRLLGAWEQAESVLTFTANDRACDGVDWESVSGCRYLGLLRWEQGRLLEAEALLRQAVRSFGDLESPAEEATTRALLGLLTAERGRPDQAVLLLQAARAALPGERPWLCVQTGLGLALALAEAGAPGRAHQTLAETWRLYATITGERELLRLHWLEGRLLARLGDRENAEQLYRAVRVDLLARENLADAAVCTHDLIVLLRGERRSAEIPALWREIEQILPQDAKLREAWRMVQASFPPGARREIPHQLAAEAARLLRSLFRERGHRVEALPFV